jgi:uncharacterized DUF497 family protein
MPPAHYHFDWDPHKAKENLRRHRVSFEQAATVFKDPLAISIFDEEHSDEEDRWLTLGRTERERLLVVVHTFEQGKGRGASIRIISARTATRREQKTYTDQP